MSSYKEIWWRIQKIQIWINDPTKQPSRKFIRNELALKIIMDCRTEESCNLKRNLGFTLYDVINTKKQRVINSIKDAFEGENMQS